MGVMGVLEMGECQGGKEGCTREPLAPSPWPLAPSP
jgi:hypothetical protein